MAGLQSTLSVVADPAIATVGSEHDGHLLWPSFYDLFFTVEEGGGPLGSAIVFPNKQFDIMFSIFGDILVFKITTIHGCALTVFVIFAKSFSNLPFSQFSILSGFST